MTAIGIFGAAGRMGQAIAAAAAEAGVKVAGGGDRSDYAQDIPGIGTDPAALVQVSDVLIDFSSPAGLGAAIDACVAGGKPIIIGTTGLEPEHHAHIDRAAASIAVLQTGNTSLGV